MPGERDEHKIGACDAAKSALYTTQLPTINTNTHRTLSDWKIIQLANSSSQCMPIDADVCLHCAESKAAALHTCTDSGCMIFNLSLLAPGAIQSCSYAHTHTWVTRLASICKAGTQTHVDMCTYLCTHTPQPACQRRRLDTRKTHTHILKHMLGH